MGFIKDGILNIDTSIDPRISPNSPKGEEVGDIVVQWTGSYPNLCSGVWIFKINGQYLKTEIDEHGKPNDGYDYDHFLTKDFGTFKSFDTWHFGEDYDEIWENYEDGMDFDEWLNSDKFNKLNNLLNNNNFFLSREKLELLYNKINQYDWRNNSCGGCI